MDSALDQAVRTVRFLAVDAVEKANSGHPGTPMGLAQVGVEIFTRYLRYTPSDPAWPNRDRFVLSAGHASALLYSLLHLAGYAVSVDDLKQFRQWGSRTPGHPELGMTEGVETTTGPLGQGIGNAVGLAIASKMMGARVSAGSKPLIDYRVFCIAGDGDLMEGVAKEAISVAGHLGLDNLVLVYDDNRITIDGGTELSFSEDVATVFTGCGWRVLRADGHSSESLRAALDQAVTPNGQPSLVIARTHIGFGSPNKQDKSSAHGSPLGKAEIEATKKAAGWPLEPTFHVPPEAYRPFQERAQANRIEYDAWQARLGQLTSSERAEWNKYVGPAASEGLLAELVDAAGAKPEATRKISNWVEQRVAAKLPRLVGGSADLTASVLTGISDSGKVSRTDFSGRNLCFGIREHGMSSIINGLSLSGFFIPFGSTFLVFSDYLRPAMRLSALMERQVVYVFSHDSVYLGEDGPTHQPVEHLNAMRLIPNVDVFRPADGMETAAAWYHAATRHDGPTVLVLSRQVLPVLSRPKAFDPKTILNGAYTVLEVENPELVLIATGSEVGTALEAVQLLAAEGRRIRVVSAPCWQRFEKLPRAEQEKLIPAGVPRATFELGTTAYWRGVVGLDGLAIGIDRFGISAPCERLQSELGFDAASVASKLRAHFFTK